MLKTAHLRTLLLIILATAMPAVGFSLESATRVWTFDDVPLESRPPDFQVGTLFDGRPAGEWKILQTGLSFRFFPRRLMIGCATHSLHGPPSQ